MLVDPFTLFGLAAILNAAARFIAELRRWFRPGSAQIPDGLPRATKKDTSENRIMKNTRLTKMRDKDGPVCPAKRNRQPVRKTVRR